MNNIYPVLENLEEDRYHESDIIAFSLKYLKNYLDTGHELVSRNYTINQIKEIFENYEPYFEEGEQNEIKNNVVDLHSSIVVCDSNITTMAQ